MHSLFVPWPGAEKPCTNLFNTHMLANLPQAGRGLQNRWRSANVRYHGHHRDRRMETDLTSNYSTACEAHKGKSGFKAFLIFQMRTCPAAHWNSSEMQVSAQGGQPAAPSASATGTRQLPGKDCAGDPAAHSRMNSAGTSQSLLFPSSSQLLSPPVSIMRW